jgi:hypothetical protein
MKNLALTGFSEIAWPGLPSDSKPKTSQRSKAFSRGRNSAAADLAKKEMTIW